MAVKQKTETKVKSKPKIAKSTDSKSKTQQTYKRQYTLALVALFILIVAVALLRQYAVAATVNGMPIWRFDVIKQLEKQNGQAVLDDLVIRRLIENEAAQKNIVINESDIDARVTEVIQQFGGDEAVLVQQLEQSGMTMEELRANFRLELILEQLVSKKEVTDEEAMKYFEENSDFYGADADFESLKETIKNQLSQDNFSQSLQSYVASLRENASIKTYAQY